LKGPAWGQLRSDIGTRDAPRTSRTFQGLEKATATERAVD